MNKCIPGQTVRFNKNIDEYELGFESGMLAQIAEVYPVQNECIPVLLDFSNFVKHNEALMTPNYYNDHAEPVLKWCEHRSYPANHTEKIYMPLNTPLPYEVVEAGANDPLTQELRLVLEFAKKHNLAQAAIWIQKQCKNLTKNAEK